MYIYKGTMHENEAIHCKFKVDTNNLWAFSFFCISNLHFSETSHAVTDSTYH